MYFIGVDYHKVYSQIAVMDEQGAVVREGQVINDVSALRRFLGEAVCSSQALLETTRNWEVMYDWLTELGAEVKLGHAGKLKVIGEARIKTDKIDARMLAHLLRCNLVPEAHVPNLQTREVLKVLRQRLRLVRMRTQVKNVIRFLLDRHPEMKRHWPYKSPFSQKARRYLREQMGRGVAPYLLGQNLDLLDFLDGQVGASNQLLAELSRNDERVKWLRTVPGLGAFLSVLIAYEIEDIARFATAKKLAAYTGLVPSTYASGGKVYHGKIIRQGNKYLCWALVEAVWPAIRKDPWLNSFYQRTKSKKGGNAAKVATARKLSDIVHAILSERRAYKYLPVKPLVKRKRRCPAAPTYA